MNLAQAKRRIRKLESLLAEAKSAVGCHCSGVDLCGHDPDCINARIERALNKKPETVEGI